MVKRKAIEAVEMELQERTFGNNRVIFCPTKLQKGQVFDCKLTLGSPFHEKAFSWDEYGNIVVDDINSFNTYPWGRLAYEEVLFGLRKDLRARFEEFTTLAKKRKRDPKFSGFGSLHLSGFVQPLQILAYEIYNGVAEAFATRREDADVSLPRMCHWVTRKWHKNHAPSHSDVVAAFSSSSCEDACGMLTPTDAELLSAHYISGDFVVSNECAVTRRMSELMSRGLKVVCSQRCLSPSNDSPSHDSPPPQTPPPRSPPPQTTPQTPPHRSPPPQTTPQTTPQTPPHRTPPSQTPPHRSPPPQTPPHQTPHHASSSRLQRLEERMTVLEAQMAMMMQEQANVMDILKSLQSDMLSFKRAQSPVITTGGETAEGAQTWTGSPEVAGWTKEARMSQLTPVQEEESGSRESTPEAEGAQVEGNQTEGSTKSIPETDGAQVEGNQTEGSTKSIPETGDFVVSNECAVTRRMSELMSRGLKVVCSQRCLSPSHDSPPPQTPPHRSPPPQTTPQTPPHRSPPPQTTPQTTPQTPPHRSPPSQTPPHQTPPHRSPPRLQRLEERMTVLEAQMAMMMQEQANVMDILKSLQSDMLSFKRAQSPVITTGVVSVEFMLLQQQPLHWPIGMLIL
ncbi:hypothetical protein F511_16108 [Dorcoceras hygrometricum]|uniref:Uncharacterized protein n=1 Tax=Dorcoceras hygrometricum TaxID=472368 RepID=A0A2Z7CWV8_9LAMI|nr:hypothetical protein F511_16108 [Dorcoceras hygrometricum]